MRTPGCNRKASVVSIQPEVFIGRATSYQFSVFFIRYNSVPKVSVPIGEVPSMSEYIVLNSESIIIISGVILVKFLVILDDSIHPIYPSFTSTFDHPGVSAIILTCSAKSAWVTRSELVFEDWKTSTIGSLITVIFLYCDGAFLSLLTRAQ